MKPCTVIMTFFSRAFFPFSFFLSFFYNTVLESYSILENKYYFPCIQNILFFVILEVKTQLYNYDPSDQTSHLNIITKSISS